MQLAKTPKKPEMSDGLKVDKDDVNIQIQETIKSKPSEKDIVYPLEDDLGRQFFEAGVYKNLRDIVSQLQKAGHQVQRQVQAILMRPVDKHGNAENISYHRTFCGPYPALAHLSRYALGRYKSVPRKGGHRPAEWYLDKYVNHSNKGKSFYNFAFNANDLFREVINLERELNRLQIPMPGDLRKWAQNTRSQVIKVDRYLARNEAKPPEICSRHFGKNALVPAARINDDFRQFDGWMKTIKDKLKTFELRAEEAKRDWMKAAEAAYSDWLNRQREAEAKKKEQEAVEKAKKGDQEAAKKLAEQANKLRKAREDAAKEQALREEAQKREKAARQKLIASKEAKEALERRLKRKIEEAKDAAEKAAQEAEDTKDKVKENARKEAERLRKEYERLVNQQQISAEDAQKRLEKQLEAIQSTMSERVQAVEAEKARLQRQIEQQSGQGTEQLRRQLRQMQMQMMAAQKETDTEKAKTETGGIAKMALPLAAAAAAFVLGGA